MIWGFKYTLEFPPPKIGCWFLQLKINNNNKSYLKKQ